MPEEKEHAASMTPNERVLAALELREPDRVPSMDLMSEAANVYEILERKQLNYGFLFRNRYASRAFDLLAPRTNGMKFLVNWAMEGFIYDRTEAAVKLGFDCAQVILAQGWKYQDSRTILDVFGRCYDVILDEKGTILSPLYRKGTIESRADWESLDKKDIFKLLELTNKACKRIQKEFGDRMFLFCNAHPGLFETSWQSMGFDRFVLASRKEKEFIRRYVKFYADFWCMMIEAFADAGVPGVLYGDDLAFRSGPMFSPRTLEDLYGESLRRITDTAHLNGMKIIIHSCGNVYALLEWFADCGFDGVHSLEPTAGIELKKVKEMVGDRLCLAGNIGLTHTLVDATRAEVHEAVRQAIEDAGAGGGYILAPTNSQDNIRVENVRWMLEAVEEYGHYPLPAQSVLHHPAK